MESEFNDFMAQLDEISADSASVDSYQLQKQKSENKKLKELLTSMKDSTKEMLGLYKSERQITIHLQEKLDSEIQDHNSLQRRYDDLERTNVNKTFSLTELMNEMKEKHVHEHENYIELCQDYFETLSDSTCFFNYEIKKSQNKIISKTERFLRDCMGDQFKKPRIVQSRRMKCDETDSDISRVSSRASKRVAKVKSGSVSKRLKTDIWDMKSISQASSPAAIQFDEEVSDLSSEICGAESSFSFNTFSIGNESSFSFLQNQKKSPNKKNQCGCHLLGENVGELVSIGVNTDPPVETLPMMPSLLAECVVEHISIGVNTDAPDETLLSVPLLLAERELSEVELVSIGVNTDPPDETPPILLDDFDTTANKIENGNGNILDDYENYSSNKSNIFLAPDKSSETAECFDQGSSGDCIINNGNLNRNESNNYLNQKHDILDFAKTATSYTTSSTNTEADGIPLTKEMVDEATSPEPVVICHKSTATVRSTTTRGTYTVSPEMKNFGVQFPEITLERIFNETIFEFRDCISPIEDEPEMAIKETTSTGTVTELCNVIREIDYVCKPTEDLTTKNQEEQSFILLGQTLFDLFLKRIRKSNESLSDDEITRRKIWKHLKRQLLDRFSELKFDETLNSSSSDLDSRERRMSYEEMINQKAKDGHEEFVIQPEEDEIFEDTAQDSESKQMDLNMEETTEVRRTPSPDFDQDSESASYSTIDSSITTNSEVARAEANDFDSEEFDEIFKTLEQFCLTPLSPVSQFDELSDVMWKTAFPESTDDIKDLDNSPMISKCVLDGYNVEHEAIEIPTECDLEICEILQRKPTEPIFNEFDTPKSPSKFVTCVNATYPIKIIPMEKASKLKTSLLNFGSVLKYDQHTRKTLLHWQKNQKVNVKISDKRLRKTRKAIQVYLTSDWTDESVDTCLADIEIRDDKILLEAIYETVEDNKDQTEICTEFSPPAPPLPQYQQRLILLIKKLSETIPTLPHLLLENLEEKLLKLENYSKEMDDLRNICYYYTALVDLFFDGDSTMVFYFIVKCIYVFGYKAIPMVFVLIKAFPKALAKKSVLLKKFNNTIDWENMTGLELSKVQFDNSCMDSLDLTVMHWLTSVTQFNKKTHESNVVKDHELFNYLPKFYGFHLNFMSAQKLIDILMKRLTEGQLENLSLSLILLAKRADIKMRTLIKENLLVALEKFVAKLINVDHSTQPLVAQICLLVEVISSIAKTLTEQKEKVQIFPVLVSVLGRINNNEIKESCILAILRIQRHIGTHKEIVEIIKHYQDSSEGITSATLRYAIQTFVHRKDDKLFKKSNLN